MFFISEEMAAYSSFDFSRNLISILSISSTKLNATFMSHQPKTSSSYFVDKNASVERLSCTITPRCVYLPSCLCIICLFINLFSLFIYMQQLSFPITSSCVCVCLLCCLCIVSVFINLLSLFIYFHRPIGVYMPPFSLIAGGVLVKALALWYSTSCEGAMKEGEGEKRKVRG